MTTNDDLQCRPTVATWPMRRLLTDLAWDESAASVRLIYDHVMPAIERYRRERDAARREVTR